MGVDADEARGPGKPGPYRFVEGRRERIYAEDAEGAECTEKERGQMGTECRALTRLGTEEDGFALEGFDGDENGDGGVDAGGCEDYGDGVPVVGAGDDFFAD